MASSGEKSLAVGHIADFQIDPKFLTPKQAGVAASKVWNRHKSPVCCKMRTGLFLSNFYSISTFTDIGRSAGAAAIAFPVTSGDSPEHSDGFPVSRHATGGHPRPWQRAAAGEWHGGG